VGGQSARNYRRAGKNPDVKHLLVTNDFPPKIGGIQSLLWEWWRRLPNDQFAVLTSPFAGAEEFDAAQSFRIERTREPVLLPHPWMVRRIRDLALDFGAELVVIDPAVPLGIVGPSLKLPYDVVLHGAEVTVPGRLPISKQALARVLKRANHVIAAGEYSMREANRAAGRELQGTVVPPGVDTDRFRPLSTSERADARRRFDLPVDAQVVVSISRLVPRKGFDTAIRAVAELRTSHPDVVLVIAGRGRDEGRLRKLAVELGAPVRFLGRVSHEDLPKVYGCADLFTMLCRNRWNGLEQEGFGIVFVEAAACGVPQVAGDSGGAAEAVADGETGIVVRNSASDDAGVAEAAAAFRRLLDGDVERASMGIASRDRAIAEFSYDVLCPRLGTALGITS
jgi:phosphatidylinositol alpha-1,6-mannosyltransferase